MLAQLVDEHCVQRRERATELVDEGRVGVLLAVPLDERRTPVRDGQQMDGAPVEPDRIRTLADELVGIPVPGSVVLHEPLADLAAVRFEDQPPDRTDRARTRAVLRGGLPDAPEPGGHAVEVPEDGPDRVDIGIGRGAHVRNAHEEFSQTACNGEHNVTDEFSHHGE